MKVGVFFFNDAKQDKWLRNLGVRTNYNKFEGGYCTEGDIDLRFIHLLRMLYNNGMVVVAYDPPKNCGIYVSWKDWLRKQ